MAWLLDDRAPDLLPTPWLSDRRFEDFVERLLKAQPLLGPQVRHVAEVERWGVPGDKQDGIDLLGRYSDDVTAAWQCKHLRRLTPALVRRAVRELTFEGAVEIYLVYADIATAAARNEIKQHTGWRLWDRRDLTAMLRVLPPQSRRDILEEFWGSATRRHFFESPEDAFVSMETFTRVRLNPEAVLNDLGTLSGRASELAAMREAMDRDGDGYRPVVLVVGPGGRGKSRLLTDALRELRGERPGLTISCLAPGHLFSASAMTELVIGPSVVVIDDAHQAPEALAALLAFARSRLDVQLVLTSRPSGLRRLTEQTIQAGFTPSQYLTVPVGELSRVEAERLVKELTDDMNLAFGLRAYLAGQAEHSPHVAVITTNLIRRGELTASLAFDAGLRQTILNRYREVLAPDVGGFAGSTTRRVLATYAAIGPVASADRDLMRQIADFCELSLIDLARVIDSLRDHGVLVPHEGMLRVVPDIVADSVLEGEAAYDDFDTGFASALWDAFGDGEHRHRLTNALGELKWRLAQRGGPELMDAIWPKITERMLAYPYSRLRDELSQFDRLAATQPRAVIGLLEAVRARLDEDDRANIPVAEDDGRPWRRLYGLAPIGRADVRNKMPQLYARAAANDPDLLETALDAIWVARNQDPRPPHSNPDHPQRMVEDHLGSLVKLPDPSFPERIVARVERWLTEPVQADRLATPLFALKPLLAKEEVETVQSAPLTISMQARGISPVAMRAIRDQIRELLQPQALANGLRRAGEAVDLLEEALREPHGFFGQSVGSEVILAWEEDDLATITTLTDISTQTTTPALRRRIRSVMAWPAEYATSTRVMHAALTTLATLDELAGLNDDIADTLLGHRTFTLPRLQLSDVPPLDELEAKRAERERSDESADGERDDSDAQRLRSRVESRRATHRSADVAIADRLVELEDPAEIWTLLDDSVRDAATLVPNLHVNLWGLWRRFSERAPDLILDLICQIADAEPGPFDSELPSLIVLALEHQPDEGMSWLQNAIVKSRREVRLSIARGFDRTTWDHTGALGQIWTIGSDDADPSVAHAFLGAAGAYLRAAPIEATDVLLAREISAHAAKAVIENASGYDGSSYGYHLERDEAKAVLCLIGRAGYGSYGVQTTLSSIARRHPVLVLDHLAAADDPSGTRLPEDIHDLGAAFAEEAEVLADWIVERCRGADDSRQRQLGRVIAAATNGQLTGPQGGAIASRVLTFEADELMALSAVLDHLDTWPLRNPQLAEAVVARARATGCRSQVADTVHSRMHPSSWGGINGESPELFNALSRAQGAASETVDPELRVAYGQAAERIQATIDSDRRRYEEDSQSGWD
ncbi:AAA family ATPase [Georgenia sp. MJ170]|uniref:AAA family ATPase n=1 Tax=Georgenia sunbinii TaxID=3117728 RepID=UPI002F26298C